MPFERYLAEEHPPRYDAPPAHADAVELHDSPTFSHNVQFRLPNLMLAAPTLAPGGGAEVLPPAFLASSSSSWLSNSAYYSNFDDISLKQHQQPIARPVYPPDDFRTYPQPDPAHYTSYPPSASHPSIAAPSPSPAHSLPHFAPPTPTPFSLPNGLGLPVYSTSGFDLLSVLCRVASRPNPKVRLGPVDMTCSFVVADIRRFDSPIVYASPSFCKLTGYQEHEVIGRNCRFLQSPDGRLQRGEQRLYTAPDAVSYLKRCLSADKECQTSVINYRKGGAAFINLVTVIPLYGGVNNSPEEADDVAYHVGFQVDLTQQPSAILQKLRDGSYAVDHSRKPTLPQPMSSSSRDWRTSSAAMNGASAELRALLADPAFVNSVPLHMPSVLATPSPAGERLDPFDGNKPLNLYLLESTPDFVHVMSLKGAFLYVAPAVNRVLGYDPEDLVGKSISEFCHPADVVPLMRELKESSVSTSSSTPSHHAGTADGSDPQSTYPSSYSSGRPRSVDLLFRMRAQSGEYVWVECRGRLHVEPGKGRKAIILSGRVRHMPQLDWGLIEHAGGLASPGAPALPSGRRRSDASFEEHRADVEREFWGLLSASGAFLFVGAAIRDVLGWGAGEVIGRTIGDLIGGPTSADAHRTVDAEVGRAFAAGADDVRRLSCEMKRKDGAAVVVCLVLYPARGACAVQRPVVCQVKLLAHTGGARAAVVHPPEEGVFSELHIARGSSWQYELQQLKFANQRLLEEVAALEAGVRAQALLGARAPYGQGEILYAEEPLDMRYAVRADAGERGAQDWGAQYGQYQDQGASAFPQMGAPSMKRTWTAYSSGDGPPS